MKDFNSAVADHKETRNGHLFLFQSQYDSCFMTRRISKVKIKDSFLRHRNMHRDKTLSSSCTYKQSLYERKACTYILESATLRLKPRNFIWNSTPILNLPFSLHAECCLEKSKFLWHTLDYQENLAIRKEFQNPFTLTLQFQIVTKYYQYLIPESR